jgi:hypothetical protein
VIAILRTGRPVDITTRGRRLSLIGLAPIDTSRAAARWALGDGRHGALRVRQRTAVARLQSLEGVIAGISHAPMLHD